MQPSAFPFPENISRDSFVVTWSPSQNAFDVATMEEMLLTNIEIFANARKGDFVVLGFAETREDAGKLAWMLQQERNARLVPQTEVDPDYPQPKLNS